jgi:hypothetical protein
MNKEGNEKNIGTVDEGVSNKEIFEWNEYDYNQGNVCGNDDILYHY